MLKVLQFRDITKRLGIIALQRVLMEGFSRLRHSHNAKNSRAGMWGVEVATVQELIFQQESHGPQMHKNSIFSGKSLYYWSYVMSTQIGELNLIYRLMYFIECMIHP